MLELHIGGVQLALSSDDLDHACMPLLPFYHFQADMFGKPWKLSAPKSQRFLRFAIAMPIADPRNRSDFRDKRKQCCIAI